jgi:hypothetical protein
MIKIKPELKNLIKENDFEGLKKELKKAYGKFNIEKSIKKVKIDPDQERVKYDAKENAVIVTYINPVDFFKYKTTKGKDIRYWLDLNSLIHNLDKLKKGKILNTPILVWDPIENKNVWHEGRHRCYAYYIAGVQKIPILIRFEHNKIPVNILNTNKIKTYVLKKFEPYKIYKK